MKLMGKSGTSLQKSKHSHKNGAYVTYRQHLGINEVKRIVLIFRKQSALCDVI